MTAAGGGNHGGGRWLVRGVMVVISEGSGWPK